MYDLSSKAPFANLIAETNSVFKSICSAYNVKHKKDIDGGFKFGHHPICEHLVVAKNLKNTATLQLKCCASKSIKFFDLKRDDIFIDREGDMKEAGAAFGLKIEQFFCDKFDLPTGLFTAGRIVGHMGEDTINGIVFKFDISDLSINPNKVEAIRNVLAHLTLLEPKTPNRNYNF